MPHVLGIDHVAFAATDLEATCAFYDRLFGARTHLDYAPDGRSLVRQIAVGSALLSIHQAGNGLELVARHPTVGGADLLPTLGREHRERHGPATPARTPDHRRAVPPAHGRRAAGAVDLFRDPDGNLLELMAADGTAAA
jgi:catechol 2,3-dioxygenase-like lactoylglutathione lyase family enzyme